MDVRWLMPLRDVKNKLSEVVDRVEREHERVVITKHGRAAAVVVSVDDLSSLEDTLDVMGSPTLIQEVQSGLRDLKFGDTETLGKDEILAQLGK